jgi:pimeloyl-ACP methyl ester carboxylesterase
VEALPDAQFEVIQAAGHFMFASQPAAFAAAVGQFLDGRP